MGAGIALPAFGLEIWLRATETTPPPTWGWRDIFERPQELNQLGFRGQRIEYADGDFVVLLVGDSQVEGDACPHAYMPERRLQEHLGKLAKQPVKVFSVGCIGYGQDQQWLGLQEYLARFRADAVIVWFTDGNDAWNNASVTHSGGWPAKPTFWLDDEGQLAGPTARVGDPVYSRLRVLGRLQRFLQGPLDHAWDRRLPAAYQGATSFEGEAVAEPALFATAPNEMAKERTALQLGFDPPSPRARYAIRLTNLLLRRMQADVVARGARFFGLLADRPDYPLADGVYAFDVPGQGRRFFRYRNARHGQAVAEVHDGIELLKPKVTVEPFCTAGDPHFTVLAVDQIMADLAGMLAARLGL